MSELESRAFVLLRRAQGAPPLAEDEAEALQARHLAYLEELAAAGRLSVEAMTWWTQKGTVRLHRAAP